MNSTNERDIKKRYKSQLLARSLHACRRSQVRKWVDEDDQKFLLMKDVDLDVPIDTIIILIYLKTILG